MNVIIGFDRFWWWPKRDEESGNERKKNKSKYVGEINQSKKVQQQAKWNERKKSQKEIGKRNKIK